MKQFLCKAYRNAMWALLGYLFVATVFLAVQTDAYAAVPSQVTDYKPQVKETRVQGTVTNSKGEEVEVTITHPGVGMTIKELDSMRDHVRAGDEPWTSAFHAFAAHAKSSRNPRIFYEWNDDFVWVPNVWTNSSRKEYVTIRGNKDGMTAVNQAIMWYITGDDVYRGNCMNVIRLWSRIQSITPEKDFRWGITSYNLAFAAEIMRYSDCETEEYRWTEEDTENFNRYLNNALGPSRYTNYFWMNQQSFANMGIISTAIFQDNFDLYALGVEQTTVNGKAPAGGCNGSIKHQCRLMTVNEETGEEIPKERQKVQLIEAGRDQGHTWATASGLSTLAQSMYVQGTLVDPETGEISNKADAVNLFNFLDDRLLKGVTTALRYNLGYDDEWITADSSRGFYREPSEASWRGRINPCLGILYNYYRYIENQDMTEYQFKDIAKAYERYMPEVTSSDDFPLAATLLYTPDAAKDNYTKRSWYAETTYHKEIENFTGDISGHPQIQSEGNINYVRMAPGAEVVCGFGWPAEGGMGLRVRSDGAATVEVRRDRKANAPKAVFLVPDTKGEWMTVTCNTAGSSYGSGDFVYFKVLGEASQVDLDYVDFASGEGPEAAVSCTTDYVEDIENGRSVYLIPAGKASEFKVRSAQDGTVFYADSTMKNCTADNVRNVLTVKPTSGECGKEQHIYLTIKNRGLASVKEIIVKPYRSIEDIQSWYTPQYHPDTAEYTASSRKAYEDAERAFLAAQDADLLQAAQAYVSAFRGLEGLLASYDFEDASADEMTDGSGNKNDGKLFRNAEIVEDSERKSKVLALDGSIHTYAELPKGILNGCDSFTISFDVKPDTTEGNFFTYGIGTDITNYSYLKTLNEQLILKITRYSNGAEQGASGAVSACKGKWIHVDAVYEQGKVSLYADHAFIGAEDVSLKLSDCGSDLLFYLGKSFWLWDDYYSGSFDNVKIYNYAMAREDLDGSEKDDVTVTYIVGDGARIEGEAVQTVKYGESTSKITLVPYQGYVFQGWSDGNGSLARQEKYLTGDVTLYARFRREADEKSAVVSYDFEEQQGKSVRDVTGNGNFLKIFGNAVLQDDAEKGNVLYLDGSAETYAELPQGILDGQNEMTVSMDVKAANDNLNANYWIMGIGQDDQKYYMLKTNDTSIKSALTKASYRNEFSVMPTVEGGIKDRWLHVTVVLEETGMRLYLDGVLLEEKSDAEVKISDFGTGIRAYLGKSFFAADEYFKGYIDNVTIYNYAMSSGEVENPAGQEMTLRYTAATGGTIQGEASQTIVWGGTASAVSAVADPGYRFVSWSDGNKQSVRTDSGVKRSISVSALFEREKISASEGLVADYEMAYSQGGVLQNKASLTGRLDAKLVNMTQKDFGKDETLDVMKFTGNADQYVELPEGLLGDGETFSIETVFQTATKANHWLYTIGNIVDGANYLFVNPMAPDGKLLAAVKDKTSEYRVTAGSAAVSEGYHMLTLTFDRGTVCIYLDGVEVAKKSTGYSIRDILKNGTADGVCGLIGKSLYAADPAFSGNVASFKVFDCVLESSRVKQRYEGKETEDFVGASGEKELEYYLGFDSENLKDGSGNQRTSVLRHKEDGKVSYVTGHGEDGKAVRLNKSGTKTAIIANPCDGLVNQSMTVSFWLKAPDGGMSSEQGIYCVLPNEEGSSLEISAAAPRGGSASAIRLTFIGQDSAKAAPYYTELSAEESFPAGEWVHVAVAIENGMPAVYRNGENLALVQGDKERSKPFEGGCWVGSSWDDAGVQTYLTATLDDFKVYNYALDAEAVQENSTSAFKRKIAAFTFDDMEKGLSGSGAKAAVNGTVTIGEDETRGKALFLDGTGNGYLSVTDEQGGSLLNGLDELTVSYYSKPGRTGANWPFYAAPDTNAQGDNPTYLGVIDNTADLTVERHNNGRKETCKVGSNGEWKHVVVVYQAETVRVYVNGVSQGVAANAESLRQILGENSILQIGKANWGSGEYYQGWIDDYSIYNYAMTEEQVLALEQPEPVEKEICIVSYEAAKGGKIQGDTVQQIEKGKDGSKVTAVPADGYEFAGWSDGRKDAARRESNVTEHLYIKAKFEKRQRIAYFSFDDASEGMKGSGAIGILSGNASFSDDSVKGNSLSLDGSSQFIQVSGENGKSLLDGLDAMTITYYSKPGRNGDNWVLYGAGRNAGTDSYLEITDGTDHVQVTQSLHGVKATAQTASSGEWKYVAAVLDADAVKLYVDGELKYSAESSGSPEEIFGENGLLQIGKSERGNGGYYQGLLDEFSIYSYAMTAEEVQRLEIGWHPCEADGWETNETEHWRICNICSLEFDRSPHVKDNGTVTKQPTETEAGEKTYRCSVCGYVMQTEVIPPLGGEHTHTYGKEWISDKTSHWHECICGEKQDVSSHAKDIGAVTKQPTASEKGEKTYRCSVCGYVMEVIELPALDGSGQPGTDAKDREAAAAVDRLMEAIGTVTVDDACSARIAAARNAYNALTNAQKKLVTKLGVLEAAEKSYQEQKKKQDEAKEGTQSAQEAQKTILKANTDKGDVPGSTFSKMKLKGVGANKSIKLSWSKFKGADGYLIYGAACGKKLNLVKDVSASKKSFTVKKLKKGKYYRYLLAAYKTVYGEKRVMGTTATVHVCTNGGKNGNPAGVVYSKKNITLKRGKSVTLKPKYRQKRSVKVHNAKFRFESSNPKVASVSKKGKVKGVKKGSCTIYLYTQNGLYKTVKVRVK